MNDRTPLRPEVPAPSRVTNTWIETNGRLDPLVRALNRTAPRLDAGPLGGLLRGDWLGHALHPLLTDIPIGCWTSAAVLDVVGGRRGRPAAQFLVALGIVSVVPTAAAGAVDWAALPDQERRRVGAVHAATNAIATACYLASWRARRNGRYPAGVAWGMVAGTVASVGGFLGGHLAFARSAGVGLRGEDPEGGEDEHALDGLIGA